MTALSLKDLENKIVKKLISSGAHQDMARETAKALVLAEAQGIPSHGLSRVSQYCDHLKNGRVNGKAIAKVIISNHAVVTVDADCGLAFPACKLAVAEGIKKSLEYGISIATVINSHHAGVLVDNLRPLNELGLVGLAFSNVPASMPMAGGKHPVFGTNPFAAFFSRKSGSPLLIDLSLSEVARGKIAIAQKEGKSIPLGWAMDIDGNPTQDPNLAMDGMMLPIGAATSPKGAMLALIVELFSSAVIGANFSTEASSFFKAEGNIPRIGQTFIIVNPNILTTNNHYLDRLEFFLADLLSDETVRLPGERRERSLLKAEVEGIIVSNSDLRNLETT